MTREGFFLVPFFIGRGRVGLFSLLKSHNIGRGAHIGGFLKYGYMDDSFEFNLLFF